MMIRFAFYAAAGLLAITGCGEATKQPDRGTPSPTNAADANAGQVQESGEAPPKNSGRIILTTGIPDKTIAEYSEAIQKNPNEVNSRGELAYQRRGAAYMKQGEDDKAIADFSEAIRLYGLLKTSYYQFRLIEVQDGRASLYVKKGEFAKAIDDYTAVIDFGGGFGTHDLGQALAIGGFASGAYIHRAECYDKIKQPEKATADYREAVRREPSLLNDELRKRLGKQ